MNDRILNPQKHVHEGYKARVINEYPLVIKINHLLNDEEVDEILETAEGRFERSNLIVDGQLVYNTKHRNSSTAYLFQDGMPERYSKNIERIIKRICYLTNCKRSQLEMMCVRYKKGEQFGNHVDYLDDDEVGILDSGGNRKITLLIYLNSLKKEDGGETEFTKLGIKSRPKKGDAILFVNQDEETGKMIPETEHRGNAVLTDTVKFAINVWVRDKPFY